MNQPALFHETIYEALAADIAAAGGFKVVAGKLWPTNPNGASTLRNALNPEQAQKIDPVDVIAIKRLAKEAGSFAAITFESQDLSFQITWVDPANEIERIERENNELLRALMKRMDRSDALRSLKAVK